MGQWKETWGRIREMTQDICIFSGVHGMDATQVS